MNKLILTESQYSRLSKFILETRFDVVVKGTINVGDVVRITYKNTTNNFRVIQNNNGQVIMDNIDAGSTLINYRYFMSFTGLHGNELDIKRVNKIKEKDKLNNISSWTPLVVKNISNIEVVRDNKVIDKVDEPNAINKPVNKKQPEKKQATGKQFNSEENLTILDDIRTRLLSLKEYHMIIFDMVDGSKIFMCSISKNGLLNELEVSKIEGDTKKYEFLRKNRIQMNFNDNPEQDYLDEILVKHEGNKVSLKLKVIEGEHVTSQNIDFTAVNIGGPCEEEGAVDSDKRNDKATAKEMMKRIISDPILKKAFYKQPTLIDTIIASMKGEPSKGKGIGPSLAIIDKYVTNKFGKKIGPNIKNFKVGKPALFKLFAPIVIKYMTNAKQQTQEFGIINPYKAIVKYGETSMELVSNEGNWKVVINTAVNGEEDTFLVDVIKFTTTKEGEIKTIGRQDNVKIRMIKSPGYLPTEINKTL